MKLKILVAFFFVFFGTNSSIGQDLDKNQGSYKLANPMTVNYLKKNLSKKSPRLFLNSKTEIEFRKKLQSDPLVKSFYRAIKSDSKSLLTQPLPERVIPDGKRLRASNGLLTLATIYLVEKDPVVLDRINKELNVLCNFSDWNPSHYLDVAGLSLAVAIAVDWAGDGLPSATVELAKKALIEKGILPSFNHDYGWIKNPGNWNQVCHGGLIASAIVIADENPELAAKTISRSLDNMNPSLADYGPDGVYREGPGYWEYGTSMSVITSSILSSAFDTDFGISAFPGFQESALFRLLVVAPSGEWYNFADNGSNLVSERVNGRNSPAWFNSGSTVQILTWFAVQTGNPLFFDKTYFEARPEDSRDRGRFAGPALIWLSQYKPKMFKPLPLNWKGDGKNPIVIFGAGANITGNNPERYYLGAKGGQADLGHSNMDAGSFIFELDGVRWSVDLGVQSYSELEQVGFDLWNRRQGSQRYTLLTKGNQGHSTLTVNDAPHNVQGYAPIIDFKDGQNGENPEATIDLTEIFEGLLKKATRRFIKDSPRSLLIEDKIEKNDSTKSITWQMMTTAEVVPVKGGAILKQDGKELSLEILFPENLSISIISLDPPPLKLDKYTKNLKRIEIRIPAWILDQKGEIKVRLSGKEQLLPLKIN